MAEKQSDKKLPKDEASASVLGFSRPLAMEITLLGLIIAIAIILRVMPLRWGADLNEYDPFFWYRGAEYISRNGFQAWFTWHDTYSWYPIGRDVAASNFLGNPFSAAFIWQVLNTLGFKISIFNVCLYFPILFACITCIAAYYLGRDIGGRSVGIFSALFLAISPTYLSRTGLGFFDTENIGIFGLVATSLLFLRSIRQERPLNWRIAYGVAGGLTLGYALVSWGAARYIIGLLMLYVVVALLLGKTEKRHIVSYSLIICIGLLITLMVPRLGFRYLGNIDNLAAFSVIGLLIAYEIVRPRITLAQARLAILGVAVLGLVAFFVLPSMGIGYPIADKFLRVLNPFTEANPLFASVGEHRVSSWGSYFGDFGLTLILSVLGLYFALKDGREDKLFVGIFFITSVYFAGTLVRLLLIFAAPASLLAAYGLVNLIKPFISLTQVQYESRAKRKRAMAMGMNKWLGVFFIIFLIIGFVPHAQNAVQQASQPNQITMSAVPVLLDNKYPIDWLQALAWIKANTTSDSIICAWWDYGYWIQAMANRTTLADGSTSDTTQIINIAHMMMKPSNESRPIMKKYDVDYVVVFVTFNPNNPTEEWPFGDNAKWPQMARIAGYNLTTYVQQNPFTGETSLTPAFFNTTIARLMYQGADTSHFELVFKSQFQWVLVYKVKY